MANEITEAVLKSRIAMGMNDGLPNLIATDADVAALVDEIYTRGNFHEFVGVVAAATAEERLRASRVCRRLGHTETARKIAEG